MQNSITQGFCVRTHEPLLRYSGCQCRVLSRWARHEHFTRFPSQEVTLRLRVSLSSPRLSVTQDLCAVASLPPASMACFTRFLRPPPPPLPDGGLFIATSASGWSLERRACQFSFLLLAPFQRGLRAPCFSADFRCPPRRRVASCWRLLGWLHFAQFDFSAIHLTAPARLLEVEKEGPCGLRERTSLNVLLAA